MSKPLVIVALSGGVDSAVSAYLLKKQGYDVKVVFMKNFTGTHMNLAGECSWVRERDDAANVAKKLKLPFAVWDFEKQYQKHVIDYFFREYKRGRTPNPDVRCNQFVKVPLFLSRAKREGANLIAMGHYARVKKKESNYSLLAGVDEAKDQSYFLYTLKQSQLKHLLFPVGELKKTEVRIIAKRAKLPVAEKKDSVGICFVGQVKITDYLRTRLPENPGKIVDTRNRILGQHLGLSFYTIGQRTGMGLANGPWYVIGRDKKNNKLIVGSKAQQKYIMSSICFTAKPHWIGPMPTLPAKLLVRHRYRHPALPARVMTYENGLLIKFVQKQRAITPGQSAVFYKQTREGFEVLGGAIIDELENTKFSW